jgi:hypothetical protein
MLEVPLVILGQARLSDPNWKEVQPVLGTGSKQDIPESRVTARKSGLRQDVLYAVSLYFPFNKTGEGCEQLV